ncbi:MAG: xylan 1,4-beta-xylosidase [Christensenellaceae bacterium]|nr:xylan 1,4-beta-xylosidase [Christensenellaceae bacterium]
MKKDNRFEVIYKEGTLFTKQILLDKKTGVQYLLISSGYGTSVTPLLDAFGKPVTGNE